MTVIRNYEQYNLGHLIYKYNSESYRSFCFGVKRVEIMNVGMWTGNLFCLNIVM